MYVAVPPLIDLGVLREAIWFGEEPRNTEELVRLIKSQFASERSRVLLVTSAWHMSRAKMLFDRAAFEVVPSLIRVGLKQEVVLLRKDTGYEEKDSR